MSDPVNLIDQSRPFLAYLEDWYDGLADLALADLVAGEPDRVAVISVDVINGFCKHGALASERVGQVVGPVVDVLTQAHAAGVRSLALTQDTHETDSPEFTSFPPHALRGTDESEAVDELKALPFFDGVAVFAKNSLNSHHGTDLGAWLAERPQLDRFVVVGDCTDLCVYQLAMQLRLEANANNLQRRVVVPARAVDTFDTPVSLARELGIKAHAADLHHVLFLHHMAINGIEVVRQLT